MKKFKFDYKSYDSTVKYPDSKDKTTYLSELIQPIHKLKGFIHDYYQDVHDFTPYHNQILKAMDESSIESIECLWSGIYYNDRDNPEYYIYLKYAIENCTLDVIERCIYAFQNYATLDDVGTVTKEEVIEWSKSNPNKKTSQFVSESSLF